MELLTRDQAEAFVRDGYVLVREVFPREVARELLPLVWARLPEDPDAPRTWTRSGAQVEEVIECEAAHALFTPRFNASVNDLVGAGRWTTRRGFGWIILRFPGFHRGPWHPPTSGWHVDGMHFQHHLTSSEQGLVGIEMLTDIEPGGGGTAVRVGSHGVVSRLIRDSEPQGISYADLRRFSETLSDLPAREMTGKAGDILWMHPHMVHARSPNVRDTVRVAANRAIVLTEPKNLAGSQRPHSLVEIAILEALGSRYQGISSPL